MSQWALFTSVAKNVALMAGNNAAGIHTWLKMTRSQPLMHLRVVKTGTFCRTVVWPCLVPLTMWQYIRETDMDYWATDLLIHASKTEHPTEFYDKSKGPILGHWRIQRDLEVIYKGARA